MDQHARALFVHDDADRLVRRNEWRGGPAPRFFLGRTPAGVLYRFRADLPAPVCRRLAALCEAERWTDNGRPRHEAAYRRLLARLGPIAGVWHGPTYRFDRHVQAAGETVAVTERNADLLEGGLDAWLPGTGRQQPCYVAMADGKAVAICASVRVTALAHEAGVETLGPYRRRGYARQATTAWAAAVGRLGATPLFSCAEGNAASQALAESMGLVRFGGSFHVS